MTAADGRRQRRDRNRESVVDAVLAMISEGEMAPGADAIAARAGLSARSVFRYFDDLDDLCRAAIGRQLALVSPHLHSDIGPTGTLRERIDALVDQRALLFETMGNIGAFARLRAPFQPLVAEQLATARRMLRARMHAVLDPELGGLPTAEADRLIAAADVMCSFEAFRLLLDDHGLTPRDAAAVMASGVDALLAAAGVPA